MQNPKAIEIKTLKLEKHGFWSIHKGFGGTPSYQCILLTEFPDSEIIESVVKRAKVEHFTAEFIEGKRGHWDPYILVKSELCHIDEALFKPFREWFQYTYPELTKNKIKLRWT